MVGVPDDEWGQLVVAVVVAGESGRLALDETTALDRRPEILTRPRDVMSSLAMITTTGAAANDGSPILE